MYYTTLTEFGQPNISNFIEYFFTWISYESHGIIKFQEHWIEKEMYIDDETGTTD